jgi:hypothetical protein
VRKIARAVIALGLVAAFWPGPGPASALPPPDEVGSKNVKYVKFVSDEQLHAIGARLVGHYLYVTSVKTITIYDVSKPANPKLVSRTNLGVIWENEDVATNGKILIVADTRPNMLRVFNVKNKAHPTEIATLPNAASHTMECVFDCKWLYGSTGLIVDLRNPKKPVLEKPLWIDDTPLQGSSYPSHDLVEVKPGRLLTSSNPLLFIDARKDVKHPDILAQGDPKNSSFIHSAMWPRHGNDKIMMSAGETNATPRCEAGSAVFVTWDASRWQKTHTFIQRDTYGLTNGTFMDGSPPVNGMGCSTHWFEQNPTFDNGGVVALGAYDHGVRLLDVASSGKVREVGYFLAPGSEVSAPHWVGKRYIYSIDYSRGIDVLKYTGPLN